MAHRALAVHPIDDRTWLNLTGNWIGNDFSRIYEGARVPPNFGRRKRAAPARGARHSAAVPRRLALASGFLSVGFGLFMIYEIGFLQVAFAK